MATGSQSKSEQNEAQNLGSLGQGPGSPHDSHGHLLSTQPECPGPNPTPEPLRRGSGQTKPRVEPPRNAGSSVAIPHTHAWALVPQSLIQRARAGTSSTELFLPV